MISYEELLELGYKFLADSRRTYPDRPMDRTFTFTVMHYDRQVGFARGIGAACDLAEADYIKNTDSIKIC